MAGVLQNSKGSRETSVSLAGYRNTFSVPMHGMIFLFGSMSLQTGRCRTYLESWRRVIDVQRNSKHAQLPHGETIIQK